MVSFLNLRRLPFENRNYSVALSTGLRVGEIAELNCGDFIVKPNLQSVIVRLYFGLLIEYNGEDRIAWKDTDMAGETCLCDDYSHSHNPGGICGKVHGMMPSVVNMWHRCTGCGRIYCDDCGKNCLPGKRFMDRTRTCPECGKSKKEIERAFETGITRKKSHQEKLNRLKEAGLPTRIEG